MSNLTGQSIGRYHILEQLGEGGMATVYKAFDTRLERDVAVKVIRTERLTIETMGKTLKRFEREAKALAKLTHPNIVSIADYGEHDGKPYLVMPHLPGGTLKQLLSGKQMHWQDAIRLLLPIARALHYAHQQSIIHRDVKPSNILITQSGDPMLTDFGIAKILLDTEDTFDLTGTGIGIGTPEYMSPEQFQGKNVDARTDIYALGVVLYEMVTGRKPYQADTPAAVLIKQATDPLPNPKNFVANLPDMVERVLIKTLSKQAGDRYQDMHQFAQALESLNTQDAPNEVKKITSRPASSKSWQSLLWVGILIIFLSIGLLAIRGFVILDPNEIKPAEGKDAHSKQAEATFMVAQTSTQPYTPTYNVSTLGVKPTPTKFLSKPLPASTNTPIKISSTKTPTTTFTPTYEILPPIRKVIKNEEFNTIPSALEVYGNYKLTNGIISLESPITSENIWGDDDAKMVTSFPIQIGNGYLLLFRAYPGSYFLITMEYGGFNSEHYRALWFVNGDNLLVWSGRNNNIKRPINFQFKSLTWYYFMMRRYSEGIEGIIWEKDKPEETQFFNIVTGTGWAQNNLIFMINVPQGVVEIDKFQELEFITDINTPFNK
ncbi:MAG: serine/threonine protein kinase [Candidatus Latescibacteria bacterium]|nr:serine/threonine protein kinase [Candidatus Latescibacterota bacterium]